MGTFINRSGRNYGLLCVLCRDESRGPASNGRRVFWVCRCSCGNKISVTGHELASGDTKSCGCLKAAAGARMKESHGSAGGKTKRPTPTYYSWQAAKSRCTNMRNWKFPKYGGRGITMCDHWLTSFEAFLADMGPRPAGHTLDRFPNQNGNYEPGNCRWATPREQRLNQRLVERQHARENRR